MQGDAAEFKLEHLGMWCCHVQKREQWRRGGFGEDLGADLVLLTLSCFLGFESGNTSVSG